MKLMFFSSAEFENMAEIKLAYKKYKFCDMQVLFVLGASEKFSAYVYMQTTGCRVMR